MQRVVIGLTCGTKLDMTLPNESMMQVMRVIAAPLEQRPSGGMWLKTTQGAPCVVVHDQITHVVYVRWGPACHLLNTSCIVIFVRNTREATEKPMSSNIDRTIGELLAEYAANTAEEQAASSDPHMPPRRRAKYKHDAKRFRDVLNSPSQG